MKFSMRGQERKKRPFKTGDCLIEVTAWSGFTVFEDQHLLCVEISNVETYCYLFIVIC